MNNVNYKFLTLSNFWRKFRRVEVVSKLAKLAKKN